MTGGGGGNNGNNFPKKNPPEEIVPEPTNKSRIMMGFFAARRADDIRWFDRLPMSLSQPIKQQNGKRLLIFHFRSGSARQ